MSKSREIIKKGIELQRRGELDQAKIIYEDWLTDHPDDADVQHLLGLVYREQGHAELAKKHILKAQELAPDVGGFYLAEGLIYQDERDLDQAVECYQKAIQLDPNLIEAYNALALLNMVFGKTDEALKLLNTAIRLEPEQAETLQNLGILYYDLQDFDASARNLQAALALQPGSPSLLAALARTLLAQNASGLALDTINKCLESEPDKAQFLQLRGDVYFHENNLQAAEQDYLRCIELAEDFPSPYRGMGQSRAAVGQYEEAIHWYQQAISKDPSDPVMFHELGDVLLQAGFPADAEQCFIQVGKMVPGSEQALQGHVKALVNMSREQDAIKALMTHAKEHRLSAGLKTELAHLFAHNNQLKEAAHWAAQALADNPALTEPRLLLAYYQSRCGDTESALKHFEELEKKVKAEKTTVAANIMTYHALALNQAGSYEQAIKLANQAWKLRNELESTSKKPFLAMLEQLKKLSDPKQKRQLQNSVSGEESPVFLFALPGAGLERVSFALKVHPDVVIADERFMWPSERNDFIAQQTSVDSLLNQEALIERTKTRYFKSLKRLYPQINDKTVVLDILPIELLNPERILSVFPQAKILTISRNKSDLILEFLFSTPMELYKNLGVDEVKQVSQLASALTLALYTWHEQFPSKVQSISYSKIADNPGKQLTSLQKHLKIEPEDAVKEAWADFQNPDKGSNFLLEANCWEKYKRWLK